MASFISDIAKPGDKFDEKDGENVILWAEISLLIMHMKWQAAQNGKNLEHFALSSRLLKNNIRIEVLSGNGVEHRIPRRLVLERGYSAYEQECPCHLAWKIPAVSEYPEDFPLQARQVRP